MGEVKGQGTPADGMAETWRNFMGGLSRKAEGWREEMMRIEKDVDHGYYDDGDDQGGG